jgi:hypothetical protein
MTAKFLDIQISDAIHCEVSQIDFSNFQDSILSVSEYSLTVEVNSTPIDCYFTDGKLRLILNANTGEKVYAS